MKKCYSYIRFSTAEQSSGDSYRRQLTASKKYAEDNGLIFDESLTIKDLGVSAYKGHNIEKGALSVFLRALEEDKIERGSILLVESLDRISRLNVMSALKLFMSIIDAGITIITLQDNQQYSSDSMNDNVNQLLISLSIMSRAHEEIKIKSERITAAWSAKVDKLKDGKIWTSRIPWWLKVVDGKIVVVPERVEVVKLMFKKYNDGHGQYLIAKHLNKQAILSPKGGKWWKTVVMDTVKNRAVLGYFTPHIKGGDCEEMLDYYPRIINDDVFYKAQAINSERLIGGQKAGEKVNSLFAKLTVCGKCGGGMSFCSRGKATDINAKTALDCVKNRHTGDCVKNSIDYGRFEMNFLYMINDIDLNLLFKNDDVVDVAEVIRGELVTKQRELNKYVTAIEDLDVITKTLISKIQKVEIEIEELESKLEDCKAKEYHQKPETLLFSDEIIKDLQVITTSLNEQELFDLRIKTRQLIQQVVQKITIHSYPYTPTEEVTEFLKTVDPEQAEEYLKVESTATQYIVELKNGMKQHVMFNPEEPELYTISHKWSIE